MLSSLRFIPRLDLYTWYMWAKSIPGRSPGSSPGALGRQAGGGCALGIRSMAPRAGATVRSCLQKSVGRVRTVLEGASELSPQGFLWV